MSEANPDRTAQQTAAELFAAAQLLLDEVVRNALLHCQRLPTTEDIARFQQRLEVLLLDNDRHRLRDFKGEAALKTWLQRIADHEVSRVLRQEGRNVGLEDAPPEVFTQPPTQEELFLEKEQLLLLEKAIPELPPHARKLIELLRQGLEAQEIAQKLGIKKMTTFYVRKVEALKKLRELVTEQQKIISERQ